LQIAAIGAARRQEAEEGQLGRFNGSLWLKLGIGAGVLLIAVVTALVAARGPSHTLELENVQDEAAARAAQVLADAKALLSKGEARAAYRKAAELPAGASARQSMEFKEIQAAYADHLFALAEKSEDASDRRALYDEIARSTSVDLARRNRAAAALTALSSQAVDVDELPKAKPPAPPPPPSAEETAQSTPTARTAPAVSAPLKSASPAKTAPSVKPAPSAKSGSSATLVRENPFER
jgi:hypothetical protein